MSSGYYLFLLVQFLLGTLVGKSTAKEFPGPILGFVIAILLGLAAIVELIVVGIQKSPRNEVSIALQVISGLVLPFTAWGIAVLFNCIGFGWGFLISKQLGRRGWEFGIPTLLAFAAIFAVVAAMALKM